MKWVEFHHPDVSFPVIRRRIGVELLELLEFVGVFLTKGGWGLLHQNCYPSRKCYYNASARLRQKGLVVSHRDGGRTPVLYLSDEGRTQLPDYFTPEKFWNRKWNGIWYLFVYDIPEADRKYRNVLRQFLRRLHMGCLQQSVWVSSNDIRPDFDDLVEAAGINAFAYLFEARTVLGMSKRQVVEDAWDFEALHEMQQHYCTVFGENLQILDRETADPESVFRLLRSALNAFHAVFEPDPLLPRSLWPKGYMGGQVYALHRQIIARASECLNNYSSVLTAVSTEE